MDATLNHGQLIDLIKKKKLAVKVYMSLGYVPVKRVEIISNLSRFSLTESFAFVEYEHDKNGEMIAVLLK